jgi:hypothetical protein
MDAIPPDRVIFCSCSPGTQKPNREKISLVFLEHPEAYTFSSHSFPAAHSTFITHTHTHVLILPCVAHWW